MTIFKNFLNRVISAPYLRRGFVRNHDPFVLLEAFGAGIAEQGRR